MRSPLLSSAAILERHEQLHLAVERARATGSPSGQPSISLLLDLLDAGAAAWAFQLAETEVSQALGAEAPLSQVTAFAWADALFETHRWHELMQFADRVRGDARIPLEPLGRILMLAARAALLAGDASNADRFHLLARELGSRCSSLTLIADTSLYEAYCLSHRAHRIADARQMLETTIALYRHERQWRYQIRALLLQSSLCLRAGLTQAASETANEALERAASISNPSLTSFALMMLSVVHYRQGELSQSRTCAESAAELVASFPGLLRTSQLALLKARISLLLGDTDCAERQLDCAEAELRIHPSANFQGLLHEYRAIVAISEKRTKDALDELRKAMVQLENQDDRSYYRAEVQCWQAEALLAEQRFGEALTVIDEALGLLETTSEVIDLGRVLRVRSFALAAVGRTEDSRSALACSEATLRKLGDLYELGLTLLARSEPAVATPEAGVAAAAEALRLFEQMDVIHLAARAREVLAQAQIRLRDQQPKLTVASVPPDPHALDPAATAGTGRGHGAAASDVGGGDALVDGIIASSPAMRALLKQAKTFAPHPGAILLTGETGVGKEVVARFVHRHSKRHRGEFVPINCAAVPESLFEREFFGHAKGAFTGADADRPGLVEFAAAGTLFLDEIGELPLPMQAKLLRLVQEGTYRRVGEVQERHVDLRIVAATNRNLDDQVRARTFREDLLYRLRTFEMEIPPLRTRPEDVVPLIHHFLQRESERLSNELWMTGDTWMLLKRYAWPGNVRELESALVCAAAQVDRDGCIHAEHLPRAVRGSADLPPAAPLDLAQHLMTEERRLILKALERTKRSRSEAARALGISRNTLYDKMKRLGIDEKDNATD